MPTVNGMEPEEYREHLAKKRREAESVPKRPVGRPLNGQLFKVTGVHKFVNVKNIRASDEEDAKRRFLGNTTQSYYDDITVEAL